MFIKIKDLKGDLHIFWVKPLRILVLLAIIGLFIFAVT
jgi:hypothetical protein